MTSIAAVGQINTDVNIDLIEKSFVEAKANIAVIGLGYVGIPLVSALSDRGFHVTGFDVDQNRVDQLNQGKSPIKHIPSEHVESIIKEGRFVATTDFKALSKSDAILICVPTPLTKQREPDLSYILKTTETIGSYLRPGQLIVLESTTWPGTTSEIMGPLLEKKSGLVAGKDFFLAYSPEREDPGNAGFTASTTPKVVGGDGEAAIRLVTALYSKFIDHVVPVSSTETAEAVKLTENIFRAVNIALVNELKVVYSAMGIDVWEVINAASTKPFGFMPFYPGPGLGGHCIPVDPFYLTWKAREFDIHTRFIELAGEINASMPRYVIHSLVEALNTRFKKSLNGSKILLVGLAYKRNVDDMRESPSLRLWRQLEEMGAEVIIHDPFIPVVPALREFPEFKGRESINLEENTLSGVDAALIATDHDEVDYEALLAYCPLIVDTRNVCERKGLQSSRIVKA